MAFILDLLSYYDAICSLICVLVSISAYWSKVRSMFRRQPYNVLDNISSSFESFYRQKGLIVVLLLIGMISTVISNSSIRQWVGIHNLQLERDGTYCYYITAEQDDKSYTMPAKIEIITDTYYYERGDGHTESDTVRRYVIYEAYWTNGSVLKFEDDSELSPNNPETLVDGFGREWECTLLNQHAYAPQVEESSRFSWSDILLFCLSTISVVTVLLGIIRLKDPWDKYYTDNPPLDSSNNIYVPRKFSE